METLPGENPWHPARDPKRSEPGPAVIGGGKNTNPTQGNQKRKRGRPMPGKTATIRGRKTYPILPVDSVVVLPFSVAHLTLEGPEGKALLDRAAQVDEKGEGTLVLALLKDPSLEPSEENLHLVGVQTRILGRTRLGKNRYQAMVRGEKRVRLGALRPRGKILEGQVEPAPEGVLEPELAQELVDKAFQLLETLVSTDETLPPEILQVLGRNRETPAAFPDYLAAALDFGSAGRKRLLLAEDPEERLSVVCDLLAERVEDAIQRNELIQRTRNRVEKSRRESWLRHQMAEIREQLGEGGEDALDYVRKAREAGIPEYALAEVEKEARRLEILPPASSESGVIRGWLDFVLELPWDKTLSSPPPYDEVGSILDRHHYGLEKVKERIAEEIAVLRLRGPGKGTILCFTGPPGTGKTSLGRAVAEALGRPYYRIALGGMRDESEIRGHRRTYVGALPGRILDGLRRVGAKDPVFLIDEVDKLGVGYQGDPAAALLEVLDPEQNKAFTDHYLGMPFDLSGVVFLATANTPEAIPPALRDRMEMIPLPGYTEEEKKAIARRFLLPRALEAAGLEAGAAKVPAESLEKIIRHYTREAGVRNLARIMEKVARKVAVDRMKNPRAVLRLRRAGLKELLGPPRFRRDAKAPAGGVGSATGLAWTPSGGDLLEVEVLLVPGQGKFSITGFLGQVMRESVHTAYTLVRSKAARLGIPMEAFQKRDLHIHFPAGAVPKDGPSAGLTVAVALASAFSGRAPAPGFAMTGELALRGRILPVGGIREKLLAAKRLGVKEVILPKANLPDLDKVPPKALEKLVIHPVSQVDQAFRLLFPPVPRKAARTR